MNIEFASDKCADYAFSYRVLQKSDLDSILEVNLTHKKVMGIHKHASYDEAFLQKLPNYFDNPSRYILGSFLDNTLVSYLCVIQWSSHPYWTFLGAKSRPFIGGSLFQPINNGLSVLTSKIIKHEIKRGRSAFWYLTSARQNRGYRNNWRLSVHELRDFLFISRTIRAGYEPKDQFIWDLMGKRVWNEDLVVRTGVLKGKESVLEPFYSPLKVSMDKINYEDDAKFLCC